MMNNKFENPWGTVFENPFYDEQKKLGFMVNKKNYTLTWSAELSPIRAQKYFTQYIFNPSQFNKFFLLFIYYALYRGS